MDTGSQLWAAALARPALPYVLQLLGGLAQGHDAVQTLLLTTDGVMTRLHALERQSSSASKAIGTLAESLLEALRERAAADVDQLRRETTESKRKAALDKRVADISTERDAALATKNATDTKFSEATTSHSRASNEMRQTLEQTRADFDSGKRELESRIGLLQQNVRDRDTQIAEEKESRTSERKSMQNQIGKLQMHKTALVDKDKMRVPPSVADGSILVAKSGLNSAFINLGKKDMLQPGTIFQIKNLNSAAVKGYATVTRVEETRAEVSLSGIVDAVGDPVRDGDAIYNDLYSPGQSSKRTIYLLGRFSYPYHKPQLTQLLENLGNRVVAKMGPGIDTVILGDDAINEAGDGFTKVEESEEYKAATMLGVEFVPMRKIRDIVKP
jgi:hypothetical protein